ncbi:hypothetical protein BKK43_04055 [Bacillus cereus]|nr:hypothetical protein BKK43_04055 [Bacillus cereus]
MKQMFEITVDIQKETNHTDIKFSQNSLNTSELNINIANGGKEFTLLDSDKIIVYFKKPDQKVVFQDKQIEVIDKAKGKINVLLTTQTLIQAGKVYGEISIEREENGVKKRINTYDFSFEVRSSFSANESIESTNEFQVFDKILETGKVLKDVNVSALIESEKVATEAKEATVQLTNQIGNLQQSVTTNTAQLAQNENKLNLEGWELQNKTREIKPLVTFVSDDGSKVDYENLRPISISKGVPFVSAIVTGSIGTENQMTVSQLKELKGLGWEMSSHTHTHRNLTTLPYEEVDYEVKKSKEVLDSLGLNCTTLCIPFGFYNDNVLKASRKYLRGARSSDGGVNRSPLETFKLKSVVYAEETAIDGATGFARNSLEWYKYNVDQAIATNGWVVFLMHSYNVDSTQLGYLSTLIDYIKSKSIDIVTLDEGYNRYGNIVDVGFYDRNDTTKKHYVVGADGTVSMTRSNNNIIITKTDEYLNSHIPSDFTTGSIKITKVSSTNATGLPENKAGTLITDRIQADGWAYQEYHVYGSVNIYKRYAVNNATWSAWSQTNVTPTSTPFRYQNAGTYTDTSKPTDFPVGAVTATTITTANAANFPEAKGGRLVTDRLIPETAWEYQEYHVLGSINVYKRYAVNDNTWSAWTQLNTTLTTGTMQYRGTDTYLNVNLPSDFPTGCITVNTITTTNSTGMPENKAGRLFTDRLISDTTWTYQTYHPIASTAIYKRYATSASAWSAWTKVSAV